MTLMGKYAIKEYVIEPSVSSHIMTYGHSVASVVDGASYQAWYQKRLDAYYGAGYYAPFDPSIDAMFRARNVLSTSFSKPESIPIFEYLECKNSVNTPYWASPEVVNVDVFNAWKSQHLKRRPKKPIYFPLRIREPKEPSVPKLYTLVPKFRSPHKNESRIHYLIYVFKTERKARDYSAKINRKRALKYKLKRKIYERKKVNIAKRRSEHLTIFLKRLDKYNARFSRWKLLDEKSKDFSFRKGKVPVGGFLIDNPYGFIALTPKGDKRISYTISWDSARPPQSFLDDPSTQLELLQGMWMINWNNYSSNHFPFPIEGKKSPLLDEAMDLTRKAVIQACLPFIESDDDYIVRKIYNKIANKKVHIGNMIAERHQTWTMLKEAVTALQSLIKAKQSILRTSLKFVKDPKKLSDEFLKFKFGAEPLANDILELAKLVDDDGKATGPVIRVSANVKNRRLVFSNGSISFDGHVTISRVYKFTTRDTSVRSLQEFGLINPGEIAWEVTPWSFVVDWFVPVGAWIEAHSSALGMQFLTGTRKIKLVGDVFIDGVPIKRRPDGYSVENPVASLSGDFICTIIDRKVEFQLPDPNRIIRIKNPWSIAHGLESLALAIQRWKSR